ncbi:SurA N-terminal domain-containing protein [Gammaproteobacteria bacterium]|nr:SurA N-terminal domain-containing protein [Gammaproteobacteria bacterium]MDB2444815.1 SurA N-terminal domain-containing protein [Gammaproteobacteria bacterium]MDC3239183.1 SurA N-terminal domain-containing protein [Gammaproteobacteria bacterium]
MLQDIRDNSQGVIAKVIIGLIVAIFVLFGAESIIGGFVAAPSVGTVNGEEITETQLQIEMQTLLGSLGVGAENLDQGLVEQLAINQLVEEALLRQSTSRLGMSVSEARIDEALIANASFQINGVFDPEFAVRTMNTQGFSVASYREALRERMLLGQLVNALSSSNFVTESELSNLASLNLQSRDFRYLSIPPGARTLSVAITDQEISDYYQANESQFIAAETVEVDYVLLDRSALMNEVSVEQSLIEDQYEEEKAAFEGSAERRAAHILFETNNLMDESQALKEASAALDRLEAGELFSDLALELSSDVVSAQDGGDIGYSGGDSFPEEIELALTELEVDEVSSPVVTDFGVHVVKLTEDNTRVFSPLEEVEDRIERDLKSGEVGRLYSARLAELSNLAFEIGDLADLAEQLDLAVMTSDPIGRQGGVGLFGNRSVIDVMFSDEVLLDGNLSDVIEVSESQSVVLVLKQYNSEQVRPLDAVEPQIAVSIRSEMEREAVFSIGSDILDLLETGADASEIISENDLEWRDESNVKRRSSLVNAEILTAVFQLSRPHMDETVRTDLVLSNGAFVIAELSVVNDGQYEDMAQEERVAMRENLNADFGSNEFRFYLDFLRESGDLNLPSLESNFQLN